MWLETSVKMVAKLNANILRPVIEMCERVDWTQSQYRRFEPSFRRGNTIMFPWSAKRMSPKAPDYTWMNEHIDTQTDEDRAILDACKPIIDVISAFYPDVIFRHGELSTLLPGTGIAWHVDRYPNSSIVHKVHVPILTNEQCLSRWEDTDINMKVGYLYEINNKIKHAAENFGTTPRVHLFFDIEPPNAGDLLIERISRFDLNGDQV